MLGEIRVGIRACLSDVPTRVRPRFSGTGSCSELNLRRKVGFPVVFDLWILNVRPQMESPVVTQISAAAVPTKAKHWTIQGETGI